MSWHKYLLRIVSLGSAGSQSGPAPFETSTPCLLIELPAIIKQIENKKVKLMNKALICTRLHEMWRNYALPHNLIFPTYVSQCWQLWSQFLRISTRSRLATALCSHNLRHFVQLSWVNSSTGKYKRCSHPCSCGVAQTGTAYFYSFSFSQGEIQMLKVSYPTEKMVYKTVARCAAMWPERAESWYRR